MNEMIATFQNDYREKTVEMNAFMKHFKSTESKLAGYKDMFDKGLYKMILLRNESRQLNDKLNDLHSENTRLARRAAVSYDELTPRPRHRELFAKHGLDFGAVLTDESTTEQVCSWLVQQLRKLYNSAATLEASKNHWTTNRV